jgi:outer membrane lipoprotein-sorting protein
MSLLPARLSATACMALVLVASAPAAEPAIIAKARAYIGTESALAAVQSVRYTGTLLTTDPADPNRQTRAAMEIIFQKPAQQRVKATSDTTVEVTALDGYDGWQRVTDLADKTQWRQTLLGTEHIRRLRANTWENFSFFRGIEQVGGEVEDHGTATIDGITCQKIAFVHAPQIIFYRFFDVATGRLVYTETESGGTIREQGEMIVSGIRFPKSIVTSTKNQSGEMQAVTIHFDQITVNEHFPPSTFAVPSLLGN